MSDTPDTPAGGRPAAHRTFPSRDDESVDRELAELIRWAHAEALAGRRTGWDRPPAAGAEPGPPRT